MSLVEMADKERFDKILKVIDDHLIPDDVARKERGEVFTHPNLVREMLFGIRKTKKVGQGHIWGIDTEGNFVEESSDNRLGGIDDKVWSNPESRFLDPANGIGNFPVIAFYKLNHTLSKKIPSDVERHKHIIQNMLFMIEIDKGNCETSKKIFKKICPDAKPNICCSDSLKVTLDEYKGEKFDVIMGNPPYQPSQLWEKFIVHFFPFLKEGGIFTFIIPTSWTSPTSDSWKLLSKKNIQLINNAEYLKKQYFSKIGSTFSYFCAKNDASDKKGTIIIVDESTHFEIKLSKLKILPTKITPESLSINKKVLINELPGTFDRKDWGTYQANSSGTHKFPYIVFKRADGTLDIKYRSEKDPRQDLKKVLLFRNGYINPVYDDGKNGVGDNIHALEVDSKKEGENIVALFTSDLYDYIWSVNKHSQYNFGGLMNMVFRDVSKIRKFDNESIFDFFGITPKEKEFIKAFGSKVKTCPAEKELNPLTNACVKKCSSSETRDVATFKCKKTKAGGAHPLFSKTRKRRRL